MDYLVEIQKIFKESGLNKKITLKSNFRSLGIDSLGIMDLIIKMEKKFGFILPDDKLLSIVNVGDLIDILKEIEGKK